MLHVLDAGEMPPEGKPRPTVEEVDAFKKAVARAFDHADKAGPADPGRVTVRRLNKTEYANTVRDLVGVDFNPAEDFPADDIGYGFDNIGDVLTLSPVLMERYLSAAEAIVQRAITPNLPKVPTRYVSSKYLEPAGGPTNAGKFRALTKGNLNTPYALSMDGDYVFRLRAYATNAGADGLKVKLTVGGNEVTTFMVTDGGDKKVGIYEWKAPLQRGEHRFAGSARQPRQGAAGEPTLHVENFSLEGPADMRPETHRRLLACDPKKSKHDQAVEILSRFATKAYRRPATADEVDRLVRLAEAVRGQGREVRDRHPAGDRRRCWCRPSSCSASNSTTGRTRRPRTRSTSTSSPRGCRTSSGPPCPTTSCSTSPRRSSSRPTWSRRSGGCSRTRRRGRWSRTSRCSGSSSSASRPSPR